MNDDSIGLLISLIAIVLTVGIFLHLSIVQTIELVKKWGDYLNKYRILILILLVAFVVTLVPVAYYIFLRYLNVPSDSLRDAATIAGRIGPLVIGIVLEAIFYYRKGKEEEE